MFGKVFAQIFDSSIASDHIVRHVFMDLIVLADKDGVVDMTADAISRRTNVPLEVVNHAIETLCSPDPQSRSDTEDGKRIVLIDSRRGWGWQIVNYQHYRNIASEDERRAYFRDKKREYRAKRSNAQDNSKTDVDKVGKSTMSTQAEAEAKADTKEQKTIARSVPPEELAGTLPLVDGSEYQVSKSQIASWKEAFPAIDVKTELKAMKAWLEANPKNKKTAKGIARFAVSWLGRAQNKAPRISGHALEPVKTPYQLDLDRQMQERRAAREQAGL